MQLTEQTQALIAAMREAGFKPVDGLTPAEARAQLATMLATRRTRVTPVAAVEDRHLPGRGGDIPVRLYWPDATGPLALILYFHGGGHVIGNVDSHDEITRAYCAGTGALVISVDYRKGPEHKFPAAVEDVASVLAWVREQADTLGADADRLAVAGDSAGGNLAAVAAILARDAAMQVALQVLVYPVADYTLSADSYRRFATGYGMLTAGAMQWFRGHYLRGPQDALDWRASPLRAPSLAGLAPALVISAQCDVLVDDGVAYAEALRAAGVPVVHTTYPGVIHGFFAMAPAITEAEAAQAEAIAALREALSP